MRIETDFLESEQFVREALANQSPEVVGARLREKRISLNLSIRDLAEKAWVSKTSIVNLEQGKPFRASTLIKRIRIHESNRLSAAALHKDCGH